MAQFITREKFEALPESRRVCSILGTPITYEQYIKSGGYFSHSSLLALKKKLKLPAEEIREVLKTYLHSPLGGGYYESWKPLAIAEAHAGATPEQLEELYNKLAYPTTCCKFPGCTEKVPYDQRAVGCCCTLHGNQYKRIRKGEYSLDDLKYECKLCGNKFFKPENVARHLRNTHGYTDDADFEAYYNTHCRKADDPDGTCRYCGKPTTFQGIVAGYASFCHNSDCGVRWYNENTGRHEKAGASARETMAAGDVIPSQIGYWLKQGLSLEEALQRQSERQSTGSIGSIMRSKSVDASTARTIRNERTRRWMRAIDAKHSNGWSKISQILFWSLWERISDRFSADDVFFATFHAGRLLTTKNREFKVNTPLGCRRLDFYIQSANILIEFDGAWFHRNSDMDRISQEERDADIRAALPGIHILHIPYKRATLPPAVLEALCDKCVDFILSNLQE